MHNRFEFVLSAIAEAQLQQLNQNPPHASQQQQKREPARRPIRSMIIDAARPLLHDAWDKLTRQPQPQPMTIYDASPWK